MQLGNHNTFGAVDDEGASGGHVGNHAEIDVLINGLEVLVILVGAGESQLGLERHAEGEAALNAFLNAVARGVDIIVKEFKDEIVSRVGDGEVLGEHLVKAFVLPVVGVGFQLEEVFEGLELNIEEVGIFVRFLDGREVDSFSSCCQGI